MTLLIYKKNMNRELKKVKKWLDANRLALNIGKTNFVIFHPPRIQLHEPVIIRFGREKIQRETCVKFLGILVDANLSRKHHINELSKKLSRTVGMPIWAGSTISMNCQRNFLEQ